MPTADLVQRLRTCSAEERRNAAMELAKTGSDEAVRELIRMVEGRRRHWFRWYDLDDQLLGVEALGETGRKDALEYLKKVYSTTKEKTISSVTHMLYCGGSNCHDYYGVDCTILHRYVLARRKLAERLNVFEYIKESLDGKTNSFERDENTHQFVINTIEKLSKKLLNPQ